MNTRKNDFADEIRQAINAAAELIRRAGNGVVLTGAGISTPSGIPDFRSPGDGLWSKYNPMEVASLSVFRYNPEKFFTWFHPLAKRMFHALPNPAHHALAILEKAGYIHTIITQNIDGLHQKAGSKQVLEVHGTLDSLTCVECFQKHSSDGFITSYIEKGEIPTCPDCGHVLKPDVILFEEQLPKHTWLAARQACRNSQLILVAGSSLEVVPVATLPHDALQNNAKLVIINQLPTYLDPRAEVLIRGDLADILPLISAEITDG